jgi:hypothetical protein
MPADARPSYVPSMPKKPKRRSREDGTSTPVPAKTNPNPPAGRKTGQGTDRERAKVIEAP